MAHFFASKKEHEVVVTDVDGNEGRVYIRELTEKGENLKLAKSLKFRMKGGKQDTRFDLATNRAEDLYKCIKRWDFTDEDGNPVPVTKENIDGLHLYVASQIRKAIDELNRLPEDRDKAYDADEDEDEDEDDEDFDSSEDSEADEADEDLVTAASSQEPHPTTAS